MFAWLRQLWTDVPPYDDIAEKARAAELSAELTELQERDEDQWEKDRRREKWEREYAELTTRTGNVYPGHTCLTRACANGHRNEAFKDIHRCVRDLDTLSCGLLELDFPSDSKVGTRLSAALRIHLEKLTGDIERLNVEVAWHEARDAKGEENG